MTVVEPTAETFDRRKHREPAPIPLAFAFDPTVEHSSHSASVVRWTDPVRAMLSELDRAMLRRTRRQSLPVEGLRGRLVVLDPDNERLDRFLGRGRDPLLVTACNPETAAKRVERAMLGWLANDVQTEAENEAVVERLRGLARAGTVVDVEWRTTDVFAWETGRNGTALTGLGNQNGYADLADYVARRLQGQEVVPGLPAVRRIASRELTRNQAELMTMPIPVGKTAFSIVVRVRVISFPGRQTPVVVLECSRRLWVRALRASYLVRNLAGYAFPADWTTALSFTMELRRGEATGKPNWTYEPNESLAPIARAFDLPVDLQGADILARGPQFVDCPLFVVHKNGLGERAPAKHGIPDRDKLDIFRRAADLLEPAGFRPWAGLAEVPSTTRPIGSRDQWWRDVDKHRARLEQETAAIAACYDGTHAIILAYHPSCHADLQHAIATLDCLLGDSVRVQPIPLPMDVHGPRRQLPEQALANAARAEVRTRAWQPFFSEAHRFQIEAGGHVDGVLVLAPQYYDGSRDDVINKRSGRRALARHLRVPAQYLRPIRDNWPPSRETAESRFEQRLLIAWSDLAWKTIGRVKEADLRSAADAIYRDTPSVTPPDGVLAVGILRRNSTRALWNEGSFVPFAIELDTSHGTCEVRFLRDRGQTVEATPRVPLAEAVALVADSGPIQLATESASRAEQRRARTLHFFQDAITEFCQRVQHPLVLIDADACSGVWPWIADARVDPTNVMLGDRPHAESDWANARLMRVRTGNAPKVLYAAEVVGSGRETGATVRYADPDAAEAELYRVTDAALPTFLSFGSLLRTGLVGGVSCYRSTTRLKTPRTGARAYTISEQAPWTDAWSTPAAVELTVLQAAPGEAPEQLTRYVEQLRMLFGHVGDWTTKPAPLFFESALREYLADFTLDGEEANPDDATDDEEEHDDP
jgi:hypothetical protein